ncbi:hypothetical protein WN55_11352 [Dufourea novaeangliae]|uniref:Uncharacterized protein n=1 Tax=Dufourea novaeangliae TaxID=178035 RepID=A0A154PAB8_DUFNO|nr:hypothetical protein WN55_11352 [Dufourea novaeangliae]
MILYAQLHYKRVYIPGTDPTRLRDNVSEKSPCSSSKSISSEGFSMHGQNHHPSSGVNIHPRLPLVSTKHLNPSFIKFTEESILQEKKIKLSGLLRKGFRTLEIRLVLFRRAFNSEN